MNNSLLLVDDEIPPQLMEAEPSHCIDGVDYLSMANIIDKRKKLIKSQISATSYRFSDGQQQSTDLIDAYHGEMHFPVDPCSVLALNEAWNHVMQEEQDYFIQHNKEQPNALRELTIDFLFERLRDPKVSGLKGLPLSIDEAIVTTYSSTQLIISALKTRPKKSLTNVLCPQGFYKGSAKLAESAGLTINTIPVDLDNDGTIIPEVLDHYLAEYHQSTSLIWLTMPGNPLIANHSPEQLEEIAKVIMKYDMDVLIDMAFDKLLPRDKYSPLPNVRVQNEKGHWQSMHERCFSITGNSKGLGGTGPWKLGAGVCGNKQWLNETVSLVTAVTFQRESTHLIYSGTHAVSRAYLESNQQELKSLQHNIRHLIQAFNKAFGEDVLVSYGAPVYTPFHCLGINSHYSKKAGINNSSQFAEFLLAGAGIDSVSLGLIGIDKPGVRLNLTSLRINGHKSPQNIYPFFSRLKVLLTEVQQGLNYSDVLKRIGVSDKLNASHFEDQ